MLKMFDFKNNTKEENIQNGLLGLGLITTFVAGIFGPSVTEQHTKQATKEYLEKKDRVALEQKNQQ